MTSRVDRKRIVGCGSAPVTCVRIGQMQTRANVFDGFQGEPQSRLLFSACQIHPGYCAASKTLQPEMSAPKNNLAQLKKDRQRSTLTQASTSGAGSSEEGKSKVGLPPPSKSVTLFLIKSSILPRHFASSRRSRLSLLVCRFPSSFA